MSDPLVATLAVLPLVLGGLWLVESWARNRSGAVMSPIGNALQSGVLVVLILVILGRGSLGLVADGPGSDSLLAGGLAGLLVVRVSYLVRALGRSFQPTGHPRPPWPFFVLSLLVYIAILPWAAGQRQLDGDEPYFLLIAHSLVHDLDTELSNNYKEQDSLAFSSRVLEPEWADPALPDGRVYSRHSLALPLVLAPAYAVAGKGGAMLTMVVIAAGVGWLSLCLALRYWGAENGREAIGAWALLALTPPLILYSHQIWVELPAALLVLVALHRIRDLSQQVGGAKRQWILLGLALALLPLLKLRFVLLALPILILAWFRSGGSRRTVLWVGLTLSLAIGGILLFNQIAFGNPFKDHTLSLLLSIQSRSPMEYLRGLGGLFWDCAFGLFASNPLWLLLVPALALILWNRSPVLTDLAICVVPYLAVVSPRREWYGAWAPPFRFGMVLLPLMALTLVPLLRRRGRAGARGLLVALGLPAVALLLLWVIVPGWTYNLAVGTNHLIDHLSIRLFADVGRFFPSLVRLRMASWLVPALAVPLAILFWWLPRRRPLRAGMWTAAVMLLAVAALPVAATKIPTGVVEFEDRQIVKAGGELYPSPWEPYRPRFRGGWKMVAGDAVEVPVVAGGQRVSIEIDLMRLGGANGIARIEADVGSVNLGTWTLGPERGWSTVSLEGRGWSADTGSSLEIRVGETVGDGVEVILDRARFTWE